MTTAPKRLDTATGSAAPATRPRVAVLDGLRGLAIVLVVLSHLGKVWPEQLRSDLGPLEGLFTAGSQGVTIFLVVGGFLVTRSLLTAREREGLRGPVVSFGRRLVRISLQVYLLLAAIAVVAEVDSTDPNTPEATQSSLVAVATYWWNEYVRRNALDARSDLGALYYLSIELQFYVVLLALVLVLGRSRRTIAIVLAGAIPVVTVWRWHVVETQGWFDASLLTTTRIDGLLWGALAAVLVDRARTSRFSASAVVGGALLVVAGVVASCSFYDIEAYFKVQGLVLAAACGLFVLGSAFPLDERAYSVRALSDHRLRWLGSASLTIFLWHVPVFEAVMRHTPEWHPLPRTLVALGVLAVLVVAIERHVARPLTQWSARLGSREPEHATTR